MNFQDDFPSIPTDNFKDNYVLVFDLTSMQDATRNCHYPDLVAQPLSLELDFSFPLEHVTELIVLKEKNVFDCSWQFWCCRKEYLKWIMFLSNKYSTVSRYSSIGTLVHFLLTTFQFLTRRLLPLKIRNPAYCRVSIWIMIAKFHQKMNFEDSLGCKKYRFLKQLYKQMMPAQLQSHPNFCGLNTIYEAFHLFKFCQEVIIGVQHFDILCFISIHGIF